MSDATTDRVAAPDTTFGPAHLSRSEIDVLARYNAEVYRGLVHTEEWQRKMADLQTRFEATRS